MSPIRVTVYVVMLAAAGMAAKRPARAPSVEPSQLPYAFAAWQGVDAPAIDVDEATELGADAFVARTYRNGRSPAVDLYAAYYRAPQAGSTWHSPLNCLPGTGWEAESIDTIGIGPNDGAAGSIRRVVVEKGGQRVLVLYWYQIHGRMVASETLGKAYLLTDSLWLRRSDAWFVRIVVPATPTLESADATAHRFTRDALPSLARLWSET